MSHILKVLEDTSQAVSGSEYGYHTGFWTSSEGPNSWNVVPITNPTNPNNSDEDPDKKKKKTYPDPRSRPRDQDVVNPSMNSSMVLGVDYGS